MVTTFVAQHFNYFSCHYPFKTVPEKVTLEKIYKASKVLTKSKNFNYFVEEQKPLLKSDKFLFNDTRCTLGID